MNEVCSVRTYLRKTNALAWIVLLVAPILLCNGLAAILFSFGGLSPLVTVEALLFVAWVYLIVYVAYRTIKVRSM